MYLTSLISHEAWVADSGDEWEPSEDEEESVTEYELAEDGSEEESHQSDSSASSDFTVGVWSIMYVLFLKRFSYSFVQDARIPDDLLVNFQRAKDSSLGEESNTEDESGSELFRIMEKSIRHCFKCGTPTATPRMFCFACNQVQLAIRVLRLRNKSHGGLPYRNVSGAGRRDRSDRRGSVK